MQTLLNIRVLGFVLLMSFLTSKSLACGAGERPVYDIMGNSTGMCESDGSAPAPSTPDPGEEAQREAARNPNPDPANEPPVPTGSNVVDKPVNCPGSPGCPENTVRAAATESTAAAKKGDKQNAKKENESSKAKDGPTDEQRQRVQNAVNQCQNDAESTTSRCATDRSGMMGSLFDGADAMARSMQLNDLSSVEACQNAQKMAGGANAGLAGVKLACSQAYSTCSSSCKDADAALKELPSGSRSEFSTQLSQAKTKCNSAQSRINTIGQNIQQATAAYQKASNCANDVANAQALALAQLCASSPTDARCLAMRQDCMNPAFAASNAQMCACLSNASACGAVANQTGTAPVTNGAIDSSNGSGTGQHDVGMDGGFAPGQDLPEGSAGPAAPSQQIQMAGQSGGGGGGGGGGANTPGLAPKPGKSASAFNTAIFGGYRGGSGAMGAPGKTGAADPARGVGTYRPNGSWIPPKVSALDLNKFRPKMTDVRMPSSNDVFSAKQILGPDVNIWHQMNKCYLTVMPSLMP